MIVEHPVVGTFWPGPENMRWWTVRNHAGARYVIRVEGIVKGLPLLVYLFLPLHAFVHPPLAAAALRVAGGIKTLKDAGCDVHFCRRPTGGLTAQGRRLDGKFLRLAGPLYPPAPLEASP